MLLWFWKKNESKFLFLCYCFLQKEKKVYDILEKCFIKSYVFNEE